MRALRDADREDCRRRAGNVVLPDVSGGEHFVEPAVAIEAPELRVAADRAPVDEALWRARLNPLRPAAGLDRNELRRLHRAIRAALEHGLARQGSTLRDYRLPDGSGGSMQDEFRVYGRRDEPCDRCGTLIARTQVAGRTTWFCPTCQPEAPAQAASSSSRQPSRSRRQSSV